MKKDDAMDPSVLTLTKTRLSGGVWEGQLDGAGAEPPRLLVSHRGDTLDAPELSQDIERDCWFVSVPIPSGRIADGVETFTITDADSGALLASFSVLAGEAMSDDLRAEVDLLRAELDMLKRAFRRHCLETM